MKAVFHSRVANTLACLLLSVSVSNALAQSAANCTEISNDVRVAVEKDPSKVLMVVEDALVINEGCAGDIVKSAIAASKADDVLAGQIVQTAVSVAPKMAAVINDAATSVVPGLAAVAPADTIERPITAVSDPKNPGKNPIIPEEPIKDEMFFIPSNIRGIFLIQPPASGPLPCDPTYRNCDCNPVSPSTSTT